MKKTFLSCDKCGAPVKDSLNNLEIDLLIVSEKAGKPQMDSVDLCGDCRNSLIKWFGEVNPLTGKNFLKYF